MIKFHGAKVEFDDNGDKTYIDRGEVAIRKDAILAYYDHAIVLNRHTIYIMETFGEIDAKLNQ